MVFYVLDDETFPDYEKYGIDKHLVKTKFFYEKDAGLQEEHAEQAIAILNSCETVNHTQFKRK